MSHSITSQQAHATAQDKVNPSRFEDRPAQEQYLSAASVPLGKPSESLKNDERVQWEAFKRELPWLCERDRCAVEMASRLRSRLNTVSVPDLKGYAALRALLVELGATPAACRKIALPIEKNKSDPVDDFLAGRMN